MKSPSSLLRLLFFCSFVLAPCGALRAHNMPGSAVALDFQAGSVDAELTLPMMELELSFKQPLLDAPDRVVRRYDAALRAYIVEHIHPVAPDGREWTVTVEGLHEQADQSIDPTVKTQMDLIAKVHMTPPPGASSRQFRFNYSVINHEVMSHHAVVTLRSDWNNALFNQAEPLGMLQYVVTYLDIDRNAGSWTQGFRTVFDHGMQHIAGGTDHLLFLLVLLLPAPLLARGHRWAEVTGLRQTLTRLLKIVSAFTLGHSLTLALGGLGWVQLPSRLVESLIAVSILVSAIHAIRPLFAGKEAYIAAGFGLVHGLAFASTIADFGFSPAYMILTILAFNLGIEVMQLLVVGCTIPWLAMLSRTPFYRWVRIPGAIFAGVAALGWIAERALSLPNPLDAPVEAIATRAGWIVAALAIFSIAALAQTKVATLRQSRSPGRIPA
ncbi:MAG: hypothetical protein JWO82_1394 [Akkermansiaceae bacterium]|nr:hypothetical protein [Akkermansiaceae bacterium]